MKKYAGYINLKNLNGVLYPSSIQNIMMKDFIQNVLGGNFYLSPTELLQAKYPITLKTLIGKETKVHGIVMLSSFYLPENSYLKICFYILSRYKNRSNYPVRYRIVSSSNRDHFSGPKIIVFSYRITRQDNREFVSAVFLL